uniref:Kinesin motor domain-containing protein n=1 Tax=Macrostomum lignano TaxID=282301 RepID=A0A1I8FG17_9PLAT
RQRSLFSPLASIVQSGAATRKPRRRTFPKDDFAVRIGRPPPMFTPPTNAASGAAAADWPEQLRQRSSGRARLVICASSSGLAGWPCRSAPIGHRRPAHHSSTIIPLPLMASAAAAAASAASGRQPSFSAGFTAAAPAPNLMLATSAAASAARVHVGDLGRSGHTLGSGRLLHLAVGLAGQRCGCASACCGSAGLSDWSLRPSISAGCCAITSCAGLLAGFERPQRDAKQLELLRGSPLRRGHSLQLEELQQEIAVQKARSRGSNQALSRIEGVSSVKTVAQAAAIWSTSRLLIR